MSFENLLWLAGLVGEAVVLAILIYRRVWRTFPLFFAFCIWQFAGDSGNVVVRYFFPELYAAAYLTQAVIDSVLGFSVLIEIAWSVLRPIQNSLPRRTLPIIIVLVIALGAVVWPFAGLHLLADQTSVVRNIVHVQQTAAILRILFFLLLAGFSQLLSIGWRDRELQVVTGLGIYSLVSLLAAMMHTRETSAAQYYHLNQLVIAAYLCSLGYWAFSFLQKEAQRREFTPQMQSFLLAVAGAARAERSALAESTAPHRRKDL